MQVFEQNTCDLFYVGIIIWSIEVWCWISIEYWQKVIYFVTQISQLFSLRLSMSGLLAEKDMKLISNYLLDEKKEIGCKQKGRKHRQSQRKIVIFFFYHEDIMWNGKMNLNVVDFITQTWLKLFQSKSARKNVRIVLKNLCITHTGT